LEALSVLFAPNGQHLPFSGENLQKISEQKLAGNATKPPKNFRKFLLVKTKILHVKIIK
jgi:hypothetical protein